ncbi:MAG: TIGR03013 family XrtA/PEP-CTERM system glycosyltransferase [Rubrivivax sp.]|nr:TIGR03013 family XrtA/PEP-CTERM system glycosyltransferase [Rubrivivax sp.]
MHRVTPHRRLGNGVLIALFDASVVMLGVFAAMLLEVGPQERWFPLAGTHGGPLAAGLFFINAANGAFQPTQARSGRALAARTALALLLALALTYAIFDQLPAEFDQRASLLAAAMFVVSAVVLRRAYVTHLDASPTRVRSRTLIFGSGEAARIVGQTISSADPNAEIVGYYPGPNEKHPAVPAEHILPARRSLIDTAQERRVDEIVVALTERRAGSMPLRELLDCKLQGVKVHDLNSHFEKRLGQIRIDYLNAGWLIFGDGFNQGLGRTMVKRVFDIVSASVLIALASPIMLVAALAIKLDSRGPVLYRQERTGLDNKPFQVVKFRSMRTDAEKDGQPRWATSGDDRITRVGRLLRVSRIDELPQLFSVLKGDMSLVGPRPERPYFVEQLTREIPFYAVRHSVKPGVTGWAQVRYQYGSTVEDSQEKLQYDLHYVKNHTLWLDLQILVETVHVVLTGKGAR